MRKVVWCTALSLVATIGIGGTASAEAPGIVVADGVTQPVFGYADAIRERVFVDSPYDSDVDGARDVIAVDTNFGAILVDYGSASRIQRTGDGIVTDTEENCWGESTVWGGFAEDACYRAVSKRVAVTDREVVTKGIIDALNLNDISSPTPLVPGRQYQVGFPLLPEDYVFPAGHRIGVIIVASYRDYGSQADQNRATITVTPRRSLIELPIVGGHAAAVRAGLV